MATAQIYQYAIIDTDDDRQVKMGSLSQPRSVVLTDSQVEDQTFNVAAETALKVYDASESIGGFTFLWIECDLGLLVQFTNSAGAFDVKTLAGSGVAGTMGPAMVLGSDGTLTGGTVNVFNGSAGTVTAVWVKNESATDTVRCRVVVAN